MSKSWVFGFRRESSAKQTFSWTLLRVDDPQHCTAPISCIMKLDLRNPEKFYELRCFSILMVVPCCPDVLLDLKISVQSAGLVRWKFGRLAHWTDGCPHIRPYAPHSAALIWHLAVSPTVCPWAQRSSHWLVIANGTAWRRWVKAEQIRTYQSVKSLPRLDMF